jgi:RES domain-containing protein
VTVPAWRLVKAKFAELAFSGDGSKKFGGRWNNPGIPLVYTAGTISLAILEILVHLEQASLLSAYVVFKAEFVEELIESLGETDLPPDWRLSPSPAAVKAVGDAWFLGSRSAVLSVPSAIIPGERNYLLNPRHADFHKIKVSGPIEHEFDPRIMQLVKKA